MNKKSIIMVGAFGTTFALGVISGSVVMAQGYSKVFKSAGVPINSAGDLFALIKKYEFLAYCFSEGAKEHDLPPEFLIKFMSVISDIVRDNDEVREVVMNDPRLTDLTINNEFNNIIKSMTSTSEE